MLEAKTFFRLTNAGGITFPARRGQETLCQSYKAESSSHF